MSDTPSSVSRWPLVITMILVGLNLRPSMAAIGPMLNAIRATIPLSYTQISLLTMLPVTAMGIAMFRGNLLAARWGEFRVISVALLVIGLASLARWYASTALELVLTAIFSGAGIAMIQAVMPGIIKSRFPNAVALLMGVYITAIMGGAALSASSTPFLMARLGAWQPALAIWSGLALIALAAWFAIRHSVQSHQAAVPSPAARRETFFNNPRAWLLGIFFGLGTASYTCVLAWLPPFFVDLGWRSIDAGLLLAYLTSMEVISGLVVPAIASRSQDRRLVLWAILLLLIIGMAGLLFAPVMYPLLWASLLGFGIGGLFPMSLIVAMDHMEEPRRAASLTAFVQGVGYLIAAVSPLVAGLIKDASSSFAQAWLLLLVVSIAMLGMVWRFRPAEYSQHFAPSNTEASRV